jgi:hypothetical protein
MILSFIYFAESHQFVYEAVLLPAKGSRRLVPTSSCRCFFRFSIQEFGGAGNTKHMVDRCAECPAVSLAEASGCNGDLCSAWNSPHMDYGAFTVGAACVDLS